MLDFSGHFIRLNPAPLLQLTARSHSDLPPSNQQFMDRAKFHLTFFLYLLSVSLGCTKIHFVGWKQGRQYILKNSDKNIIIKIMKYEMKQHLFFVSMLVTMKRGVGTFFKISHFALLRKQHTSLEGHKVNK